MLSKIAGQPTVTNLVLTVSIALPKGMQQRYVPVLNLIVPQIKKGMIFVARGVWILAIPLPSEPHF